MRLPNTDLLLWDTPFLIAGHRDGVVDLHNRPGRDGWTGRLPTTSPTITTTPPPRHRTASSRSTSNRKRNDWL
jgi:hypothetical protein